ncbi:MAG: ATP-binding cassette domain-containing protein [Nitrospirales bacterium]
MALLEIEHLTFAVEKRPILDDLSFSMESQEIHALLGANGSGKSTLAYVLMGCETFTPARGTMTFKGIDLAPLPMFERARLGMTLAWQEPARFEGLTVSQYIKLGKPDIDPSPYLTRVGLSPGTYRSRFVDKSLSGGERKRIELAAVLAMKPRFAILDEPTAGIDMLSVQDMMKVIRSFKEEGASVLLITHQETIALMADRASQLCGGRIIASGSAEDVAEKYKKGRCVRCDGETCLPLLTAR